jgi:protease IV
MRAQLLKALLIFLGCVVLFAIVAAVIAPQILPQRMFAGGETIARISIEGVITAGSGGGGLLGTGEMLASSVDICERLYQARDDDSVGAVVLRVDSPGGAAAGSDEIYRAILAVRGKKPVVVSMGDVAASGGYYLSSAADYIYANGATLTGSIGVIFSLMNWQQLAAKVGVQDSTLAAGEYKDIGSPWRPMTDTERKLLKDQLHIVHEQFIKAVADGRKAKLKLEQVRKLATGMVYTGEEAQKNGLIDAIGGLHEAEVKARELAQAAADTPVEEYGTGGLWDSLFSVRGGQPLGTRLLGRFSAEPLYMLSKGLMLNETLRDLVIR